MKNRARDSRGFGRTARAALGAVAVAVALSGAATRARAQTRAASAEELKSARELFQEAYRDEQEKRFTQALEKFQRVAAVKESASVRYRIAAVLASLGRLREARDAYRALAASKSTLPASEQEISDSSAERAQALDHRIPRLVVKLQENPPPDARVTIDGAPVPASTTPRPFEVDPGEHVVQATAPTAQASETTISLREGSETTVTVVLPLLAGRSPKVDAAATPTPTPDTSPRRDRTLAFVALGAGGVMLITGIAILVVREGEISDLNKDCRTVCPSENRNALESKHDEAQLFGPLGVGIGAVGLLAAGAGAYLLFRPLPSAAPANGTSQAPSNSLRIGPHPVRGGAGIGLAASF